MVNITHPVIRLKIKWQQGGKKESWFLFRSCCFLNTLFDNKGLV